ncbi:blaR1 peptidase M56 family protein [Seonamhaeicola algicola]|uniref:BlaR1 peptidase M56 family protein n=1 Tax=Seonamhaeicola algicola TaxID=1719036 RepID=A0A5C7ALU9_9FLAO|nr:M56 family metallopeptidase [Seonamhaeicola algicola]TXE09690.1 blaR1 peptidase M56 family protein [Seonamhaeicola algicola]
MVQYVIQTIAFQLFFLIIYDFILKKETFFNWNRAYLIGTTLLSLIIPLIKIERFKNVVSQEYIISLPEVFLGNKKQQELDVILLDPSIISSKTFWYGELIFFLGALIAVILLGFKCLKIFNLFKNNPKKKVRNLHIINLLKSNVAFSFFKYIFLGELIDENKKRTILKHEMVHVKQYHTLDLLLFEVLRIFFWFNPLIYMYQNRIGELHEFLADANAVKTENKSIYYQNLLSQVFDTEKISFINPFFKQSLIKKRIVMLQKSKSKQINLLKYVLLIPLVFGMLIYTSCTQEEVKSETNQLSISEQVESLKLSLNAKEGQLTDEEKSILMGLVKNVNISVSNSYPWKMAIKQNGAYQDLDVPFGVIEQVPVFPGCNGLSSNNDRKACMSKEISSFVNKNFNTKIANEHNLTGRQRISVIFKINKEGNVVEVRSRASHPALEEEAKRVINLLPKMIPGEHKGKKVNVPYSLPIIFEVVKKDSTKE